MMRLFLPQVFSPQSLPTISDTHMSYDPASFLMTFPPQLVTLGAKPYAGKVPFFFGNISSFAQFDPVHGASHLHFPPTKTPFKLHSSSAASAGAAAATVTSEVEISHSKMTAAGTISVADAIMRLTDPQFPVDIARRRCFVCNA